MLLVIFILDKNILDKLVVLDKMILDEMLFSLREYTSHVAAPSCVSSLPGLR